jgi:fumarate reductase subunit D
MKINIKDIVTNILILLIGIYLPFAFIANEFNPLEWHWTVRSLYVLTIIVIFSLAIQDYKKK